MRVLVTGATGFVGRHVIPALLELGHEVVALARREPDPEEVAWLDQVCFVAHDFHQETAPPFRDFAADALLHLAWSGLPDYRAAIHLQENYPASLRLVEQAGADQLLIFHHDPSHDDAFMDQIAKAAEEMRPGTQVAREGMQIEL